jgi:pentatricopeptide repeat protein
MVRSVFEALAIDNDIHAGLAFITRLYKLKYYVSGFTYALFIQALAKHQNSQGCMFVFLHMEKAKFAPHAQTFNALIHAFAMIGDYQTAYRIMQDMQSSKLQPNGHTFAAIIEACCRAGKMDLALDMFEYLKAHHTNLTTTKQIHTAAEQDASARINKNIKLLAVPPQPVQQTVPLTLGPQPYAVLIGEYLRLGQLPKAIVSRMRGAQRRSF